MKHIMLLLFVSALSYGQQQDYAIAKLALEQLPAYDKYRIIKRANNSVIAGLLSGFDAGSDTSFRKHIFYYNDQPVIDWVSDKDLWGEAIASKIEIIEDFDKVPKVSDIKESKSYLVLSNPAFSKDGQYAIISIDFIADFILEIADNQVYLFKRDNDKWVYQTKFTGAFY